MKQRPTHMSFARWLALQSISDRRVLARGWQVDADEPAQLAATILEPASVQAQWERLGPEERRALEHILGAGGSLPVAIMQRKHGVVRDPANFPNARSYLNALQGPASPAERLYLLGLIVRHHDSRGAIFQVPQEFVELLPPVPPLQHTLQVAPQAGADNVHPGTTTVLEQTILTLLTLAYSGELVTLDDGALNKASLVKVARQKDAKADLKGARREADWWWIAFVRNLATSGGLLRRTTDGLLHATPAALTWLGAPPAERAKQLLDGWLGSRIDELTLLGGLRWRSAPFNVNLPAARRTLLDLIATLAPNTWFSLADIISAVRGSDAYFLRQDGRFDTWLLYDHRGQLLTSETHWPEVEGVLIRCVLQIVLYELGIVDVAAYNEETVIRITPLGAHLLDNAPPPPAPPVEPLVVQSTFEVLCPPGATLLARFQLARIGDKVRDDEVTIFKLTRKSILRAAERGISGDDVLAFFTDHSAAPVPPAVVYSIRQWSDQAGQVSLESATLLRAEPVLLQEIRRAKAVQLPEVEELRPDVWRVPDGDASQLLNRLKQAGFGVDAALNDGERPFSDHDLQALVTAAFAHAYVCAELDLPSEISASMLMRLRKLVPARQAAGAQHAAEELRTKIRELRSE